MLHAKIYALDLESDLYSILTTIDHRRLQTPGTIKPKGELWGE